MRGPFYNRASYQAASLALIALLAILSPGAQAGSVSTIIGGGVYEEDLGTPFIVCQSPTTCERRTAPSFTSASRVWGGTGSCRTSTTEGATWGACTAQPFGSGQNEFYAEASDGSVIGIGRIGVGTCSVKRSTDNAATWTLVFTTSANLVCGGAVSGGNALKCVDTGECVFVYLSTTTARAFVLYTADNGVTWTEQFYAGTGSGGGSQTLTWNGTLGIAPPVGSAGTDKAVYTLGSGTWVLSGNHPVEGQSCYGSFIMNGSGLAMCYSATRGYHIRNTAGTVVTNSYFPGYSAGAARGGAAFSRKKGTIYSVVTRFRSSGSLPVGLYVSIDNGATFNLMIETGTGTNSMSYGDMWESPVNHCIYTSGGTSPFFMRVC